MNLYAFVVNNPINEVDPFGLAPGDWWDPRTWCYLGEAHAELSEQQAQAIANSMLATCGENDPEIGNTSDLAFAAFCDLPAQKAAARECSIAQLEGRAPSDNGVLSAFCAETSGIAGMTDGANCFDLASQQALDASEAGARFSSGVFQASMWCYTGAATDRALFVRPPPNSMSLPVLNPRVPLRQVIAGCVRRAQQKLLDPATWRTELSPKEFATACTNSGFRSMIYGRFVHKFVGEEIERSSLLSSICRGTGLGAGRTGPDVIGLTGGNGGNYHLQAKHGRCARRQSVRANVRQRLVLSPGVSTADDAVRLP